MTAKKVLIVGGVAGGASAATRLRRLDESAEIIMFERGEHISFANCGLPYFIGDTITDRNKLLVATPALLNGRFGIDVRTFSEVISVNTSQKTVRVRSLDRGEYDEAYDELILSPGAKPIRPNWNAIQDQRVHTLRNIPDMDKIKAAVDKGGIEHAVVIGGGFIGIEMAENLIDRGIKVSVVDGGSHPLAAIFDDDIGPWIAKAVKDKGVQLISNSKVESLDANEQGLQIVLQNGETVSTQLVILAIGVQPDTAFLKDSGIELGARGHVLVNASMQTSVEHVYAVGDAVEVVHFVHGEKATIPLAGPANKQGRIVASQVSGVPSVYKGTQGTAIIKWFEWTMAATGLNERTLKQLGMPHRAVVVHPASHASYYPGSNQITLKVIFNPEDGSILGAQAFGKDGVDKRMDVLATTIRLKGKVSDLVELELSYAPPYSSAKDPVNMAGMVAENMMAGVSDVVSALEWYRADAQTLEGIQQIDVRTPSEHAQGHIPGSVNIPVDQLRKRLSELDPSKPVWVYCRVGYRGYTAARILMQNGFNQVRNLTGGYLSYEALL